MRHISTLSLLSLVLSACASAPAPVPPPSGAPGTAQAAPKTLPRPITPDYDAELTEYAYPFKVYHFEFVAQKQHLQMAYMDLLPDGVANPPTIVMLHGKNFGGYVFESVAKRLLKMGYRVLIPDQIGFGKSSKPEQFQYTFQQLASFTRNLIAHQEIKRFILIGHSMGGMLAARIALMYPELVSKLILINPLGLEDWRLLTAYHTADENFKTELKQNYDSIKKYQMESYYSGDWKPAYDELIKPSVGWTLGNDFALTAWNAALTSDMIFTQPVMYEFGRITSPTALIIGEKDQTALGKAWATPENQQKMGHYPELGRAAAKAIPHAKIFELHGVGHVPFVENEEQFFTVGLIPALTY